MYKCVPFVDSSIPAAWSYNAVFKRYWETYGPKTTWSFGVLTDGEEIGEDRATLSQLKIENWHLMGTMFEERDKLRWVLHQSDEKVMQELDRVDRKSKVHCPTVEFRSWYENAFYVPLEVSKLHGKANQWCGGRSVTESLEQYAVRIRDQTKEYRAYFGDSTSHRCGGCARNEPCDVCGEAYPLQYYSNKKSATGAIVTTASNGRDYVRWQMRCSNKITQEMGLHVCSACGLRNTTYRERQVELAQSRRKRKACSVLAQKKYDKNPFSFPTFVPKHGRWKGVLLRLRVLQNGISTDELHETVKTVPITVEMIRVDTVEVLSSYSPGSKMYGTKTSNGCSVENRKRVMERSTEREAIRQKKREKRKTSIEKSVKRRKLKNLTRTIKAEWVETYMARYMKTSSKKKMASVERRKQQLAVVQFTTLKEYLEHQEVKNTYKYKMEKQLTQRLDCLEAMEAKANSGW